MGVALITLGTFIWRSPVRAKCEKRFLSTITAPSGFLYDPRRKTLVGRAHFFAVNCAGRTSDSDCFESCVPMMKHEVIAHTIIGRRRSRKTESAIWLLVSLAESQNKLLRMQSASDWLFRRVCGVWVSKRACFWSFILMVRIGGNEAIIFGWFYLQTFLAMLIQGAGFRDMGLLIFSSTSTLM